MLGYTIWQCWMVYYIFTCHVTFTKSGSAEVSTIYDGSSDQQYMMGVLINNIWWGNHLSEDQPKKNNNLEDLSWPYHS